MATGIVYRTISGHLLTHAGLTRKTGHTGAVTLIQRFGSALNLNVHFHLVFVDGVSHRGLSRDVESIYPQQHPVVLLVEQRMVDAGVA